jgi:YHS domain-containing protein/copper chaperone CopZ
MKPKTRQKASKVGIDPVCGMEVDPETARYKATLGSETYSFCAEGCKTAFEQEPELYIARGSGDGNGRAQMKASVPTGAAMSAVDETGLTRLDAPVQGIHCASCVGAIENALGDLAGVRQAVVNFATERVSVAYDPERIGPQELGEAVSSAGPYRLLVTDSGAASEDVERELRDAEYRSSL